MIPDNYDELTVDETLDALADVEGDELVEFIEHERDNKNRVSVLEPLVERLDSEPVETDDSEAEDDESEDADDDDDSLSRGDEVTVTKSENYGYAAGLWFDTADETKDVTVNTRIRRAIEDGELELVE